MGITEPFASLSYPRTEPSPASLCSSHRVTLGLPELCLNGISENWLLRHCGAVHWAHLADALGVRPEQVLDKYGERLYASFFRIDLSGRLTDFVEGDEVELDCELRRISPIRYKSDHVIRNGSRSGSLRMAMCSTFVRRRKLNDNVHLIFSEPARSAPCLEKSDCASARLCRENAKRPSQPDPSATFIYDPAPLSDFNAVGLFYFAQYQTALDSAEWQMHRQSTLLHCGTTQRTISYFGNLNLGDKLKISFSDVELSERVVSHTAAVYRESDNFLIAEAITRKERQVVSG